MSTETPSLTDLEVEREAEAYERCLEMLAGLRANRRANVLARLGTYFCETPSPDCEMCEDQPPPVLEGVVQHCEGCSEPSLATEQARELASRWAEAMLGSGSLSDVLGWQLSDRDLEQLFAWVRARMIALAPERPDRVDLSYYIALDLDLPLDTTDVAMQLCEAAGWPS